MTLTSAPRGETLVDAARALAPRIAAVAERIEAERALPSELVDALVDAGMFSLLLPRSLGGCELDLPTYVRAVEELARADGSVAWCVGQANGLWSLLLHGDRETVRRVVATRPAILATGPGQGNRPGRAIVTEGGFRLTGRSAARPSLSEPSCQSSSRAGGACACSLHA